MAQPRTNFALIGEPSPIIPDMRRRRRKLPFAVVILALLGTLLWRLPPVQAVFAISNLSDPAKLATLGERGANPRLNKIVYWLHEADAWRLSPETTIWWAQRLNWSREPRASLVRTNLVRNLAVATELGLLAHGNLTKLRNGHAAVVTRGPYAGQAAEVDHIVPRSLAPEVENELANLELLPAEPNRRKSDRVGERQLAYARQLHAAGLLTAASLERVIERSERTGP